MQIVGSPSLPTRDVMQKFLEEFNPKSIKKHKRRHNLLFVGFAEKKNFDDIIDKNGTTLGKLHYYFQLFISKSHLYTGLIYTFFLRQIYY